MLGAATATGGSCTLLLPLGVGPCPRGAPPGRLYTVTCSCQAPQEATAACQSVLCGALWHLLPEEAAATNANRVVEVWALVLHRRLGAFHCPWLLCLPLCIPSLWGRRKARPLKLTLLPRERTEWSSSHAWLVSQSFEGDVHAPACIHVGWLVLRRHPPCTIVLLCPLQRVLCV